MASISLVCCHVLSCAWTVVVAWKASKARRRAAVDMGNHILVVRADQFVWMWIWMRLKLAENFFKNSFHKASRQFKSLLFSRLHKKTFCCHGWSEMFRKAFAFWSFLLHFCSWLYIFSCDPSFCFLYFFVLHHWQKKKKRKKIKGDEKGWDDEMKKKNLQRKKRCR